MKKILLILLALIDIALAVVIVVGKRPETPEQSTPPVILVEEPEVIPSYRRRALSH